MIRINMRNKTKREENYSPATTDQKQLDFYFIDVTWAVNFFIFFFCTLISALLLF